MQHNHIHRQRAAVYQWFSQLLFRELDEEQLIRLESGESRKWLASLKAIPGLSVDVKNLERSLVRRCAVKADSWSWRRTMPRCFCWHLPTVFLPMRGIIRIRRPLKNARK